MQSVRMREIRIFIADDHAIMRETLCRLLSLESDLHVVGQADNGLQVLDAIRCCAPDVVLLDLNMPGLDGLAILQQLHQSNLTARVILLTGSDDEAVFASAHKFEFCSVVQKQAGAEVLITSIRSVRHQAISHICPTPT